MKSCKRLSQSHFKVHGGKYQRGQGHWDGEPGRNGEVDPENSQHGGDCYRHDDPAAEFTYTRGAWSGNYAGWWIGELMQQTGGTRSILLTYCRLRKT